MDELPAAGPSSPKRQRLTSSSADEQPQCGTAGSASLDSCAFDAAPDTRLQRGWVHAGPPPPQFAIGTRVGGVPLEEILTERYWRALAEGCGVRCCDEQAWATRCAPAPLEEWPEVEARRSELQCEGYTRLAQATDSQEATALAAAIATLVRCGWHPLWALGTCPLWPKSFPAAVLPQRACTSASLLLPACLPACLSVCVPSSVR
jgi:hypothetical protein